MMNRKRRITISLIITMMVFAGLMVQAQSMGRAAVPKQPPLSKTVIVGNLIKDPDLVQSAKPPVMGREIVISGPGMPVAQQAYDVFLKGGNFFDAAMPFMWMTANMGGQFMPGTAPAALYHAKEHKAAAHIGVGTAPALLTMDLVRNVLKLQFPSSETDMNGVGAWVRANLIPLPDTMIAILDRWGTMSWKQSMEGAYDAMMNGVPAYPSFTNTARSLFTNKAKMTLPIYVEDRAVWGQGGAKMPEGFPIKRIGAGRIIREMADAEQAALAAGKSRHEALIAARDEFYKGGFAKAIDQFARDTGGFTRWADYAAYQGYWVEQGDMPHTTFMGIDFYTDPPQSQAPMLLQILNMLEQCEAITGKTLVELGYNTPEYIHFLVACFDLANSDRWQYYGDPKFVDVPAELWSKEYAKERVKLINMNRRFARMVPPGDPRNMKATLAGWREWTLPPKVSSVSAQATEIAMIPDEGVTDTTHGGMLDKDGNIISFTPSDPGPLVPGYGVSIAGRARQFIYDPNHPGCLSPGKRPLTTPHTWVGVKDGEGYMECQTPGGDDQVVSTIQVLLNFLIWGMNPELACEQPKFTTTNCVSWFTPHIEGYYEPGVTEIGRGLPQQMYNALGIKEYPAPATLKALEAKGHKIKLTNYPGVGSGQTMAVRDPVSHILYAGSVPFGSQNHVSWGR